MASEAEVDLVISTAGALPELTRDLDRIIRQAEDGADEIDVQASLAVQNSLAVMSTQLDSVLNNIDRTDPTIDVDAALDAQESLRNLRNDVEQLTRLGDRLFDPVELHAELDIAGSLAEVTRAVNELVEDAQRVAPAIEVEVEVDRDSEREFLQSFSRIGKSSAEALGTVSKSVAGLGLAVGSALPAVASLAAALQQVAPAAAVGTQAMLAQQLVAGTLKLAMIGVEDAIENAFDPDVNPEELQKSLAKLAPEARKFVLALQDQREELKALQQGVQNRVFRDFGTIFTNLGAKIAPQATSSLNKVADSLNRMGREVAVAAGQLSDQGVLGQALDGATLGLQNLEKVPARVARSFGFLSAAAAPAFNRITAAIDELSLSVATKLQRAFESGALERAIDNSIALLSQLGTVLGNFGEGIANIFSGLTQSGRGLFDILETLSEAFVRLTASKEFQSILNELALTADVLLAALLPLIEEAFKQLGPVIETLAPVVRDFITAVGPELIPIIQQLGPILVDIALIMKEQLPVAIMLTKGAIGVLSVALTAVSFVMNKVLLPAARAIASFFDSNLGTVLSVLPRTFNKAFDLIAEIFGKGKTDTSDFTGFVKTALGDLGNAFTGALVDAIGSAISSIKGLFNDLGSAILGALSGLVGDARRIGFDIMAGLGNGLLGGIGRVLSIAQGIANSVADTIKGALEIRSPSRVMARIGDDVVAGFIMGMERSLPALRDTGRALANAVTTIAAPPGTGGPVSGVGGTPIANIPGFRPINTTERIINVYLGDKLVEQIVDDRIKVKQNQNVRIQSQGVRI